MSTIKKYKRSGFQNSFLGVGEVLQRQKGSEYVPVIFFVLVLLIMVKHLFIEFQDALLYVLLRISSKNGFV